MSIGINSRNIEDLDPQVRPACYEHVRLCRDAGIELLVTSTYRDFTAQDALYAIGRTIYPERRPVTNAKAGHSFHNFKVAWDVVPIVSGKPVWDEKDPLWKEVVRLGKAAGAEAGADWPLFKDLPHFQIRPTVEGLHIALDEAMHRFKEHGTIFTA